MGQHFLTDRNIISRIVDAAGLNPGDDVLEIGAGPGDLTEALSARVARVTAVELDRGLAAGLREHFAGKANVRVLEMDALELRPEQLYERGQDYSVVANLPYNVGTAIVRRLLESGMPPRRLVVMLQKEVALAMVAAPGEMSLVSVGVQVYATGKKLFDVPPGAFRPPPRVMSSLVRLDVLAQPFVPPVARESFFDVVRAGFSGPRKQLRNSLAQGLGKGVRECEERIRSAGLEPSARPQTLSVEDWVRLSRSLRD